MFHKLNYIHHLSSHFSPSRFIFSVRMSKTTCEKYFYYFYLLGLGYYNPNYKTNPKSFTSVVQKSAPAFCLFIFSIFNTYFSFYQFNHQSPLTNFLYTIFVALKFLCALMVFKRSSFLRRDTIFVWEYLLDFRVALKNHLKMDIDFRSFNEKYRKKLFCLLIFCFTWLTVKILFRINHKNSIRQIAVFNMTLVTLGIECHIIFYVDLFTFFIERVNQHSMTIIDIDRTHALYVDDNQTNISERIVHHFRMLKLVHFKLWEIIQILNDDLGSVLTVLIVNCGNAPILTFYWTFIDIHQDDWSIKLHLLSKISD